MPIEILWIVPIFAVVFFILGLLLLFQHRRNAKTTKDELQHTVDTYNSASQANVQNSLPNEDSRLTNMEDTISLVSNALSTQQEIIDTFKGKDENISKELNAMKVKLQELQREYDITLSENYSLKAKINKITGHHPLIFSTPEQSEDNKTIDPKILADTRYYKAIAGRVFDDTSEIDISGIN